MGHALLRVLRSPSASHLHERSLHLPHRNVEFQVLAGVVHMKITLDNGTVLEIPKMICPKCWLVGLDLETAGERMGTRPANPLVVLKKLTRDGSKLEIRVCPECEHKQYAVVDEWTEA